MTVEPAPPANNPPEVFLLPAIDDARMRELAALMTDRPVFFTPPFSDRAYWEPKARKNATPALLAEADSCAARPIPPLDAALFAEYSRTGTRKNYEKPASERVTRLNVLMFAEGLSATGRYLPALERELAAILDEPAWASPAHVGGQADWTRCRRVIDLAAASRAWSLAAAAFLHGDTLAPDTLARIRNEVRDRVLSPYSRHARTGAGARTGFLFRWMNGLNNWNAVCNAGVCGAALLLCESREERAWFAAAFETFTRRFIDGYADDGYCHEGIGYWVYGFGRYLLGAEAVRLAAGGRVDLVAGNDKVRLIGAFGSSWEITGGLYPLFGDVSPRTPLPAWLAAFCARRFGAPCAVALDAPLHCRQGDGAHPFVTAFGLASPSCPADTAPVPLPLRAWFPAGGALVARRPQPCDGLAVALKGGDNGQSHCHHDLGSFVVVCNGEPLFIDHGRDTYVRDTFSEKRFTNAVMNSFGHPVPLVAGRLQRGGSGARAVTLHTDFTDACDSWSIDLTSAYDVPGLGQLTRTFAFSRAAGGRLEIRDRVRFSTPQTFETSLILAPDIRHETLGVNSLLVRGRTASATACWTALADGRPAAIRTREEPVFGIVREEGPKTIRLALGIAAPLLEAELVLSIAPAA